MLNSILVIVMSMLLAMFGSTNISDETPVPTPDTMPETCTATNDIVPATPVALKDSVAPALAVNTDSLEKVKQDSILLAAEQQKYSSKADAIINTAKKHIGARYRMGATGPPQFDCSGFTSYVYKKAGISITRTSRSQFTEGVKISRTHDLKKGDLVFFGGRNTPRSVGHVGIVTEVDKKTGVFKFIHASSRGVIIDKSTASYYKPRYLGARRILTDKKVL